MDLRSIFSLYQILSNPLVFLIIVVVFILIIRALVLWYWRINHIINRQDKQNELLEELIETMKIK